MTFSLQQVQGAVYEILQKDPTAYGLLTPTKVNNQIQMALDDIASEMMTLGGGWLTEVAYANIVADTPYVTLPDGIAMINFVKIKDGTSNNYRPIKFCENADGVTEITATDSSGAYLPGWRFSSSRLFLEPKPNTSVTDGIMLDAYFFPAELQSNADLIDGDLDNRVFIRYATWRAASTLFKLSAQSTPPWEDEVLRWELKARNFIARRSREPTPRRSFNPC